MNTLLLVLLLTTLVYPYCVSSYVRRPPLTNANGNPTPFQLPTHRITIPENTVNFINSVFPGGKVDPSLLSPDSVALLRFTSVGTMNITFLHESAGYKNQIAYFLYDESTDSVVADSYEYVFPDVSMPCLKRGMTATFGPFPAGTTIGFAIFSNGYYVTNPHVFHSVNPTVLNPDGKNHVVLIQDSESGLDLPDNTHGFIVGFEDLWNLGDRDFKDALLYMTASGSLDTTGVPEIDGDRIVNCGTPTKEERTWDLVHLGSSYAALDEVDSEFPSVSCTDGFDTVPTNWKIAENDFRTRSGLVCAPWGSHTVTLDDQEALTSNLDSIFVNNLKPHSTLDRCFSVRKCNSRILIQKDFNLDTCWGFTNGRLNETDPAEFGWESFGDSTSYTVETSNPRPGSSDSSYLAFNQASAGTRVGISQLVIPCDKSAHGFKIRAWSRRDSIPAAAPSNKYAIFVDIFYKNPSNDASYGVYEPFTMSTTWNQVELDVVPFFGKTISHVFIYFIAESTELAGRIYLDDVEILPSDGSILRNSYLNTNKVKDYPNQIAPGWASLSGTGENIVGQEFVLPPTNNNGQKDTGFVQYLYPKTRYESYTNQQRFYLSADVKTTGTGGDIGIYIDTWSTNGKKYLGKLFYRFPDLDTDSTADQYKLRDFIVHLPAKGVNRLSILILSRNHSGTVTVKNPRLIAVKCDREKGVGHGDPHYIDTATGTPFDIQAPGEFQLAESEDGAVEIQVRHLGVFNDAAVISEVAVRLNDSVIFFSQHGQFTYQDQVIVDPKSFVLLTSDNITGVMSYDVEKKKFSITYNNHLIQISEFVSATNINFYTVDIGFPVLPTSGLIASPPASDSFDDRYAHAVLNNVTIDDNLWGVSTHAPWIENSPEWTEQQIAAAGSACGVSGVSTTLDYDSGSISSKDAMDAFKDQNLSTDVQSCLYDVITSGDSTFSQAYDTNDPENSPLVPDECVFSNSCDNKATSGSNALFLGAATVLYLAFAF